MTTDEAIAFAREKGFQIWSLTEKSSGTWMARLAHKKVTLEMSGKPGFNDGFTDYGESTTPAEAIIRAMGLRINRETGATYEVEVLPFSQAAEKRIEEALSAALQERRKRPIDRVDADTMKALYGALEAATTARKGKRRGRW